MISGYLNFLKSKDILPTVVALIVGGLVSEIINRIKDDVILPLSKLDYKTIWERVSIKEYIALVINFFMQTFILYSITYAHND
jgi:large-conductance mechanosensitive channel